MADLQNYFAYKDTLLRPASDGDIPHLVRLINEAYSYQDEAKGAPRTNPDHLRKRVSETLFYVAQQDKQLVGCVYLEPKDTSLHFGLLTVIPRLRGTGLAQALMAAIEKYAKSQNYQTIELDYMSLAPWLKPYYEGYGFQETGDTTVWGSITLVRMKKSL